MFFSEMLEFTRSIWHKWRERSISHNLQYKPRIAPPSVNFYSVTSFGNSTTNKQKSHGLGLIVNANSCRRKGILAKSEILQSEKVYVMLCSYYSI